jgi:exosortase A-associated hydrolase 1
VGDSSERLLEFSCEGDTLLSIIHQPSGTHGGTALLVLVGGPQYRVGSHRQFVLMARAIAATGVPVMRFDYRGMGDATGEFRGFEHVESDIRAAIDAWSRSDAGITRFVLWGLCDAASAAMMYAAKDDRVTGIIAANPWARSGSTEARSYVRHYYGERLLSRDFWKKLLTGRVNVVASVVDFIRKLLRASRVASVNSREARDFRSRMLQGLQNFGGSVLVLMSGRDLTAREFDELVAVSPEWQKYMKCGRIRREDLPLADHTFSVRRELDSVSTMTCSWLVELGRESANENGR